MGRHNHFWKSGIQLKARSLQVLVCRSNVYASNNGCPFSISYATITATAWRISIWKSRSFQNLCGRMPKSLNLLKRVYILDLTLDMKSLASFEWPSLGVDALEDSLRPESAMALFPSGILIDRHLTLLRASFFSPPLNVTLSLKLADEQWPRY